MTTGAERHLTGFCLRQRGSGFFMAEKVTLTPDGLMVSRWNGETKENDEELMDENDPTILSHLRTYCEIDPDTTLWHIMDFVRKSEDLTYFISQYTWTNSIDEFHEELDKTAVIDENDKMDHLEIYWSADYHKSKKYTSFGLSAGFHGVGLPLKAEDRDAVNAENGYDLPVGFIERYSVSASPLNEFTHLKLVLNTAVDVHRIKRHPKTENIKLLSSECEFSLLDILDAIYFDISFHGPPSQRDEFIDGLREQVEGIEDGTIETFPMEDMFEELGIPPRTEEDNKEDDATDAGEWDIEI
jgi:hypothetical protein